MQTAIIISQKVENMNIDFRIKRWETYPRYHFSLEQHRKV
jgi:hypothetical protein